jgi:DNA processing protein
VFAVPGPIDSAASSGTNALLRQGGILVRGVADILEELEGVTKPAAAPQPAAVPTGMDEVQQRIWALLAEGARHLDDLAEQLHSTTAELSGTLLLLEMKKIVRRLPGNQYERC